MRMLALAVFTLALPVSTIAASGSRAFASPSADYHDAVRRADKDYDAANRRCEVLGLKERNLCRNDSTLARRAAIAEAQTRQEGASWNLRPQQAISRR
jgi:hypothetical protein